MFSAINELRRVMIASEIVNVIKLYLGLHLNRRQYPLIRTDFE